MAWPLIVGFFFINLWLIGLGLVRRGAIYEVPFLVGSVFMGFVLPQLPALADDPLQEAFPIERMILVSCGCALMTGLGWLAGQRPLKRGLHLAISERRLLYLSLVLSLGGAYFYYRVSRLPPEIRLSTMPSGTMVVYSFLQRFLTCGLVVAVLCLARKPSVTALAVVLFDLVLLGDRLLMGGRKGETTEALLAVLIAIWFYRRWAAPRFLALVMVLLAAVSLNSTAAYRSIVRERQSLDWSRISQIDFIDNFLEVLKHGGPETRNAIERMDFVARNQHFDYGSFHWNVIVYNFVPAQLVGADLKKSLQAYIDQPRYDADYQPDLGSTETGMSDAFGSFWYFGVLKFFIIAYILARIYCTAQQGWILPQILYIFGITAAMLSVSHHTQWLFSTYIQLTILLLPGLVLLQSRRAERPQPRLTQAGQSPLALSQR